MVKVILYSKNKLTLLGLSTIAHDVSVKWPEPPLITSVESMKQLAAALSSDAFLSNGSYSMVIIDLASMACYERHNALLQLNLLLPSGRILALTQELPDSHAFQLIAKQSCIVLPSRSAIPLVEFALNSVAFAPTVDTQIISGREKDSYAQLSSREVSVLKRIMAGLANVDIGRQLGIELKTVSAHRKSIYLKLGVSNLAGLHEKILRDSGEAPAPQPQYSVSM
ncbi:helix-turn-helix transcriptional regulator [Rouxiella sp. Mn2063]|uniref:helix-turn-helix transcriptional regulator n=1 Tax=Rouxiella sp. Mn2063 TaxID=3395262 RepID=UPI003BC7B37D